jgi:hypothetical protein
MATGSGGGSEDAAAAMDDEDLRAYQDYMLRGAKPNSNKKTPTAKVPFSTTSPSERSSSSPRAKWKGAPSPSPRQKHLSVLHRSFQSSVRAWVETDDQLLQVSRSVANLRDRIWVTSRALTALREEEHHRPHHPSADRGWMEQGYRPSAPSLPPSLPEHVLQVALSDSLVQHEKMLALFRQLVSQLSQDQDALGRRAEDLFLLQVQEEEEDEWTGRPQTWRGRRDGATNDDDEEKRSGGRATDDPAQGCVELHAACARELYRKQRLAQLLLGSTTNAMLHSGTAANDSDAVDHDDEPSAGTGEIDERDPESLLSRSHHRHPRSVASFCARTWSRASRASELFALRDTIVAVEAA